MWTALVAVMVKELRQAFRDRRTAFLLLVAPVIQLTVLGYAVDLDVDQIPTVVVDQDQTPASRSFVDGLTAGKVFQRIAELTDAHRAQEMLETGIALGACSAAISLALPEFRERLLESRQ